MITQQQAEGIAEKILGRPASDAGRPWSLRAFEQGWLVREAPPPDGPVRGGGRWVIEREAGRVLFFASSVPPGRILNEYAAIQDLGLVENM